MKLAQKIFLSFCVLPFTTDFLFAKSHDEYMHDIYALTQSGDREGALKMTQQALLEFPDDIDLTNDLGELYYQLDDKNKEIEAYEKVVKLMEAAGIIDYRPHVNLTAVYSDIGARHHFSKEVCLRINYHQERAISKYPDLMSNPQAVDSLRKILSRYELAKAGAKMLDKGGDGTDFQLPDDGISLDEKMKSLKRTAALLKEYDANQGKEALKAIPSDKSVNQLIQLVKACQGQIKTIHSRKIDSDNKVLEDYLYKSPDKLKISTTAAVSVINNKEYQVIDQADHRLANKNANFDTEHASLLKPLGFYDLNEVVDIYKLDAQKVAECPSFLSEICKDYQPDLYLITGTLIDANNGTYPSIPKIEFFIDVGTGLCLLEREYWISILGSGKELEVATENIIDQLQKTDSGLWLPLRGRTIGYVRELRDANAQWTLNIISINMDIADSEFVVSAPPKPQRPLVQTAISKQTFSSLVLHQADLINDLLEKNYIDQNGLLQDKFLELSDSTAMELADEFAGQKQKIYDLMKSSF